MGSLLRSYRFYNCLTCITRNSFVKLPCSSYEARANMMKYRKLHIFPCHQLAQRMLKVENAGASVQEQMKNLDRAFYKLDMDVQRNTRLYYQDVENVLNYIQQMTTVNSNHALLLIRCCGELLQDETFSSRIELTNRVWRTLNEHNCQMDVSHFNALLKVYLENEYKFLPTDFLGSMEQNGVEPNRVTYQRLITRYCQDGDIEGASKVLEFMKDKELPVNEAIFNSLVMGHTKSGDMTGAREILDVMRNAKLDPSARTYSALACGYARSGDIQGLQQVLKEAEQNEVFLLDEDYLDIIHALATSGHSQHIAELIPKLPKLMGFVHHCISTIYELVNEGHDDEAFALLKVMPRNHSPSGELAPSGNFFIRQLVRMDVPLQKILQYCSELKQLNMNDKALVKAVEFSLVLRKPDLAVPLLKEMHNEGNPVRSHYFWPMLIALRKHNDEATYNILKLMTEMQCPITTETYCDYVFPNLNTSDSDIIIQQLKGLGEHVGPVVNALVRYYLLKNLPELADGLIQKYPVNLSAVLLSRPLSIAYRDSGDISSVLKILNHIKMNPETSSTNVVQDYCGNFVEDCIIVLDQDKAKLKKLLQEMKSMAFQISYASFESIQSNISYFPNQQELSELLQSMVSQSIQSGQLASISHPKDMSLEDLESHLLELKSKGMNTRGVLRRLLLAYCRTRNYDRALEVKEEMERENMEFSAGIYSQLMDLCVAKGNLEEALQFKELIEQTPDFVADDFKILNLSALLIANDRYDDAKNLVLNYKDKFRPRDDPDFLTRSVSRVLQAAAEKGNVDLVKELYELLVVRLGFTSISAKVLSPVIQAHLINNDVQGAISEFENAINLHKVAPYRNALCKKLIDTDDSENLQKVLDHCISIHGEMNALHDLAGCFIECGRFKQAKKIFETPGLRARNIKLETLCEHFVEQNTPELIVNVIGATSRLFDVNKEMMYWHLLRAYVKQNDIQKALGVWTTLQEEDIVASRKILLFLSDFLKKNNQPIPFTVPPEQQSFDEPTISKLKTDITSLIKSGELSEALEEKERQEAGNTVFGVNVMSQLIEALVKNDRMLEATKLTEELLARGQYPNPKIFRFLLSRMAALGDVKAITSLQPSIPTDVLPRLSIENKIVRAMINSNQQIQVLEKWEETALQQVESFALGDYLAMLQRYPDLEGRLLKLADAFIKEGFQKPLNMVWMYWLINEKFDQASETLKRLDDSTGLMFRSVVRHALQNNNENISGELCKVAKTQNLSSRAKGVLFGCHVDVLVNLGKTDNALAVLKDAMTNCKLIESDFGANTLRRLHSDLLAKGKAVPFIIPASQVGITKLIHTCCDYFKSFCPYTVFTRI